MVVCIENPYSSRFPSDIYSFYINLPFGAVAAAAILFAFQAPTQDGIRKSSLKEKILHMDIPGVVFISAAIICFTIALRWAGAEKKWSSADVVGTLVGSILFALAFVLSQWLQGERAFITGRIFRQPTLRTAGIFEFLSVCRLPLLNPQADFYIQRIRHVLRCIVLSTNIFPNSARLVRYRIRGTINSVNTGSKYDSCKFNI